MDYFPFRTQKFYIRTVSTRRDFTYIDANSPLKSRWLWLIQKQPHPFTGIKEASPQPRFSVFKNKRLNHTVKSGDPLLYLYFGKTNPQNRKVN
jgi:hypothetical protein